MPRFHFDIIEGDNVLRDEQGEMCLDHEAAEIEAINTAAEMVKHGLSGLHDFEREIQVRDAADESLVRIRLVVKLEIQRLR
jgi:uncharacterized protein DUF6894